MEPLDFAPIKNEGVLVPSDPEAVSLRIGCMLRLREQELAFRNLEPEAVEVEIGNMMEELEINFGDNSNDIYKLYSEADQVARGFRRGRDRLSALVFAAYVAFPFIERKKVKSLNRNGRFPMGGWEKFALKLGVCPEELDVCGQDFLTLDDYCKSVVITYIAEGLEMPEELISQYNAWSFDIYRGY